MRCFLLIILVLVSITALAAESYEKIISEADYLSSIGNCPCPYNTDENGHICGKRSAWCKTGGYSPICDLDRISYQMREECKIQ